MSKGTFEKGTLRPEVLSQFGNSGHDGDVIFSDSWISSRSRRRGIFWNSVEMCKRNAEKHFVLKQYTA